MNFCQANLLVAMDKITDNVSTERSKWHVTVDGNIHRNGNVLFYTTINRKPSITAEKKPRFWWWTDDKNLGFSIGYRYCNKTKILSGSSGKSVELFASIERRVQRDRTDLRSMSLANRNHLMGVCIDGSSGTARICLSDAPRGNLGRAGIQRVYGPTVR